MSEIARGILERLAARGWSIGVAESLTGGLVVSALVDVPGASASVRGGVVAYATEVKHTVLGVDAALLATEGPVDVAVAQQMAEGVRRVLGADVGVATTGVAGPGAQDDKAAGTVCIAVVTPHGGSSGTLLFDGDRGQVRREATRAALDACLQSI